MRTVAVDRRIDLRFVRTAGRRGGGRLGRQWALFGLSVRTPGATEAMRRRVPSLVRGTKVAILVRWGCMREGCPRRWTGDWVGRARKVRIGGASPLWSLDTRPEDPSDEGLLPGEGLQVVEDILPAADAPEAPVQVLQPDEGEGLPFGAAEEAPDPGGLGRAAGREGLDEGEGHDRLAHLVKEHEA